MKEKKIINILFFVIFFVSFVGASWATDVAQKEKKTTVQLQHNFSGAYTLVERSDWSQYVNGKYIGLTSREARGYLNPVLDSTLDEEGTRYSGSFYVFQETKRNNVNSAQGLDEIQKATFVVKNDNSLVFDEVSYYPQLRNFPVFPEEEVKKGSRWQSVAERVIDPKNDGQYTILQIPVEYEFVGEEIYNQKPVYRIRAKFATRLNQYNMPRVRDSSLRQATGTHDVNVIVDAETCGVIMILDRMDETFTYSDGGTVRYRGNISLFTEIPVQVEKQKIYERAIYVATGGEQGSGNKDITLSGDSLVQGDSFTGTTGGTGSTGSSSGGKESGEIGKGKLPTIENTDKFQVEDTDQGIRLSIRNLQFYADSAQLLPGEEARLDAVAEVLRSVPEAIYLIEGHTASVGRPDGEKQLSVERAKAIINQLVKRGFRPEQFMYYGYGGTKPIADNDTEEGRALNRRVEITILQ
ncbi:MAG: OmpA family protein [Spirochaetaceae bacterium]|nr:OmpA family protein [Spirochaetaceae bacterium]